MNFKRGKIMDKNKSEKLYLENEKLTSYIIKKYFFYTNDNYEDIMQVAKLGLWHACCQFDETKGFK